jgi:hypothetical protein
MSPCSTLTSSRYIHALVVSLAVLPSCMSENETPVCTITAPWQYEFCPTRLDANSSLIIRVIDWPTDEVHIIGKEVENVSQYILNVGVPVRRIYSEGFDVVYGSASESAELHGVDYVKVATPDLTVFPRDWQHSAPADCSRRSNIMDLRVSGQTQRISIQSDDEDEEIECFGLAMSGGHWIGGDNEFLSWGNLELDVAPTAQPTGVVRLMYPIDATLAQLQQLGSRAATIQAIAFSDEFFAAYSNWLAAVGFSGRLERCPDHFQDCALFDVATFEGGQ